MKPEIDARWYPDLAAERLGGRVLVASDEFFGPKESLLRQGAAVFDAARYTDHGKWMDGWETRRRRTPGHDWCVVRLGFPGVIRAVSVDTRHFRGNHPERASIDACRLGDESGIGEELAGDRSRVDGLPWTRIVPESPLEPDAEHLFGVDDPVSYTHVRLNIYPDGGVARLRVHGEAVPDWSRLTGDGQPIDLAALRHGGMVLACSDEQFGPPLNLIMPGRAADMGDGWETRRRRVPGHDWVVIRLGRRGIVRRVEVDTLHFKGNHPESFSLEAIDAPGAPVEDLLARAGWKEGVPRTLLEPDRAQAFDALGIVTEPATHVRLNIYPDGGVSRLRVFGDLVPDDLPV